MHHAYAMHIPQQGDAQLGMCTHRACQVSRGTRSLGVQSEVLAFSAHAEAWPISSVRLLCEVEAEIEAEVEAEAEIGAAAAAGSEARAGAGPPHPPTHPPPHQPTPRLGSVVLPRWPPLRVPPPPPRL